VIINIIGILEVLNCRQVHSKKIQTEAGAHKSRKSEVSKQNKKRWY
jgi:hypothetical protein